MITPTCDQLILSRDQHATSANRVYVLIMSNVSQADFDFWDFVACARCQLPFIAVPGVPPQIPFWLTECGHVICNSHLSSCSHDLSHQIANFPADTDQSCAQCGAQSIQLVPLQRDVR